MDPVRLLGVEGRWFLFLLAGTLVYKMLTRQIVLSGLLARAGSDGASPERVQLLLATLAVAGHLLFTVMSSKTVVMPAIDPKWLYLSGGSSAIYAGVKAATMLGRLRPGRGKK